MDGSETGVGTGELAGRGYAGNRSAALTGPAGDGGAVRGPFDGGDSCWGWRTPFEWAIRYSTSPSGMKMNQKRAQRAEGSPHGVRPSALRSFSESR